MVVVALGILSLAEREQSGGVGRRLLNGGLKALDALLWGASGDASDVVLKGAELDLTGRGEEGLLCDVEMRVDLTSDLPREGILDIEEALQFARILDLGGHAQVVHLENLGLSGDAAVRHVIAADDDIVGVESLGDADSRGAGGTEVSREAEMIERVLAVVAGNGEEAGRIQALVEGVGEGLADPREVGL